MKRLVASLFVSAAALAAASSAVAQSPEERDRLRESIAAASAAVDDENYAEARARLATAADAAERLDIQRIASQVADLTKDLEADIQRFVLAESSTLTFDNLLKSQQAVEQILRDPDGQVVRVRVFGDDDAMGEFMAALKDSARLRDAGIEKAEMAGEPALKRRTADGGLSVLMMSEKDHALVELEGDSEAAVMAIIEQLERKSAL